MTDTASLPTDTTTPAKPSRRRLILIALIALCVIGGIAGAGYIMYEQRYIYTDKAEVEAPLIALSAEHAGMLKRVYVNEGDSVHASQNIAWIGDDMVTAQTDGLVVDVKDNVGSLVQPGQSVVTMIQPEALRIVARIDEDKGLSEIYTGQKVEFTIDAFGSRTFNGTVESVSPTKRDNDVVFSISDKRETKQFDVKVRYDAEEGARFRNGMSARVWIIK